MTAKKQSDKATPAGIAVDMTFEKALERLESIVTDLESGKIDLEKMIERFEEGQKLVGFCTRKLNEVERRIEILVNKGGETTTEAFPTEISNDDSIGLDPTTPPDADELF